MSTRKPQQPQATEKKEAELQKPKYKVLGIDRGKTSMKKYGQELEKSLNALHNDGYVVKVFDIQWKGTILMGVRGAEDPWEVDGRPQGQSVMIPIGAIPLGAMAAGMGGPAIEFKSPHSARVTAHVLQNAHQYQDNPEQKQKCIEAIADQLLSELSIQDATAVADDVLAIADRHDEIHKGQGGHDGCDQPDVLRAFNKAVKTKIQMRVQ